MNIRFTLIGAFSATALVSTSIATADTDTRGPQANVVAESATRPPPNLPLLASGAELFAVSYVPSVFVAALSDRSADKDLYIPVAGPWVDLGRRDCSATPCTSEWLSATLLVVDGLAQAIGAVTVAASFFVPEHTIEATVGRREGWHLSPAKLGQNGYGLAAIGAF